MTQKNPQAFDVTETHGVPRWALAQFSPEEFYAFWPQLEKMLDQIPHTWKHWTKEWIQQAVGSNVLQMWGIGRPPAATLVFFTQVNVFPALKVLSIVWGAGSFDKGMLPLIHATLMNFAKLNGCSMVEFYGREGWEPHLKGLGFKKERSMWSVPVPDMRIN